MWLFLHERSKTDFKIGGTSKARGKEMFFLFVVYGNKYVILVLVQKSRGFIFLNQTFVIVVLLYKQERTYLHAGGYGFRFSDDLKAHCKRWSGSRSVKTRATEKRWVVDSNINGDYDDDDDGRVFPLSLFLKKAV